MPPTLWLSCHVDYACRDSGLCCRAGWPLPVESRVVADVDAAIAAGRLTTTDGARVWLISSATAPDGMAGTLRQADGGCVFHHQRAHGPSSPAAARASDPSGRHCAVHATLGAEALPATCRHFPRVCVVDDRGVRVSLSHVCPTAAAMLVDHAGPVSIVDGPAAVAGLDVPEGLDVRGALPPRLTADVLIDLDALTAWEAFVIHVLAGPGTWDAPVDDARATLRGAAERLRVWRASDGPLADHVRAVARAGASARPPDAAAAPSPSPWQAWALAASVCELPWAPDPLPPDIETTDADRVAPAWHDLAPVVRRYLAARAFAAWMIWHADATRGLLAWLDLAAGVLRAEIARGAAIAPDAPMRTQLIEALGRADRLLVHDADGPRLADVVAPPRPAPSRSATR